MSTIRFMLLLGAGYLSSYAGTVNGMFIFHIHRGSSPFNSTPPSLDQPANDDFNPGIPFPPFFSIFNRRTFFPFHPLFDDRKEDTAENSSLVKQNESSVNMTGSEAEVSDKVSVKTAGPAAGEKLSEEPEHHIRKKVLEAPVEPSTPAIELHPPFRQFHENSSDDYVENNETGTLQNATHSIGPLTIYVSEIDSTTNSSALKAPNERGNCIRISDDVRVCLEFIKDCTLDLAAIHFDVFHTRGRHRINVNVHCMGLDWKIDWAAVGEVLGISLLIVAFAILLGFLRQRYCSAMRHREQSKLNTAHV